MVISGKERIYISFPNPKTYWCGLESSHCIGKWIQEIIYQRALEIEFVDPGMKFAGELSIPIYREYGWPESRPLRGRKNNG